MHTPYITFIFSIIDRRGELETRRERGRVMTLRELDKCLDSFTGNGFTVHKMNQNLMGLLLHKVKYGKALGDWCV